MVDCALYFTHTFAERGSSGQAATTLLLDQSIVKLVEGGAASGGEGTSPLAEILSEAQLNGVAIDTVVYICNDCFCDAICGTTVLFAFEFTTWRTSIIH